MGFDLDKKNILEREDKSKKQSVDEDITTYIDSINTKKDYYTTSSCSGRISLFKEGERKDKSEWLFVTHNPLTQENIKTIKDVLESPPQETLWLRSEPFILHVSCRSIGAANEFLLQAKKFFKRSSILSARNNPILEIRGSEFLDMPLSKENTLKIDKQQIDFFLEEANKKLIKTKEKTKKFFLTLADCTQ